MAEQRGSGRPRSNSGSNSGSNAGRPTGGGRPTSSSGTSGAPRADRRVDRRPNTDTAKSAYGDRAAARGGDRAPSSRTSRPPQDSAVRRERKLAPLPDALPEMLDRSVLRDLRSLTPENAEAVAQHLVSAGMLIDEEPERALLHAQAARASAARLAVVREAVGICAYHCGQWALALAELRAVKRMTGSWEHLAIMADCERALGRPRKAIDLANEVPPKADLPVEVQVELAIVISGARRDLGEFAAAVVGLQGPLLQSESVQEWTPRLWYAYAEALLAAGRVQEARERFASVAAVDDDAQTDAEERLAQWDDAPQG